MKVWGNKVHVTKEEAYEADSDYAGICMGCGEYTTEPTEPDTRGDECWNCGERKVYGFGELVMTGKVVVFETEEDYEAHWTKAEILDAFAELSPADKLGLIAELQQALPEEEPEWDDTVEDYQKKSFDW